MPRSGDAGSVVGKRSMGASALAGVCMLTGRNVPPGATSLMVVATLRSPVAGLIRMTRFPVRSVTR